MQENVVYSHLRLDQQVCVIVYFWLTHCYICYDMVILQQILKILGSWQTFAASNNIRNHIYCFY